MSHVLKRHRPIISIPKQVELAGHVDGASPFKQVLQSFVQHGQPPPRTSPIGASPTTDALAKLESPSIVPTCVNDVADGQTDCVSTSHEESALWHTITQMYNEGRTVSLPLLSAQVRHIALQCWRDAPSMIKCEWDIDVPQGCCWFASPRQPWNALFNRYSK